jgi:hypothetical protein
MTVPRIHVELIPLWFRRRYEEAWDGCERDRLGEHDERAAQSALKPRTGAVSPSVRNLLGGAMGGYRRGQ